MPRFEPAAVLFDLDGTLIDSAPDLLAALDEVRRRRGLPPSDHCTLRHHASRGAAGILEAGLGRVEPSEFERARTEFLDHYADNLWRHTRPFAGIDDLLEQLTERGIALGIVTNKVSRFTLPVLDHAGWKSRFGCVITGDRVERPKPDPEPVLAACRALDADPARTLFVGDDQRDIQAGRAAGTRTVVANWGYLSPESDPASWNADLNIATPVELLSVMDLAEFARGER